MKEEMEWLTPTPRKLSPWALRRLSVGMNSGPWMILGLIMIWAATFMCMLIVGQAFKKFRLGQESVWPVLFSLLFPAFWLGIVGYLLYTGERNRRLLETGEIARGKVLDSKMFYYKGTATEKRVKYQFTATDGETYEVSVSLPPQLVLDETADQVLFYDPQKPRRILPYAVLAWYGITPDVEAGEFRVTSVMSCVYAVIVPAVNVLLFTVMLMALCIFFRWI